MSISREEVDKIACLACIKLSEDEKAIYRTEVNKIIEWVDQLRKLDTSNVEPMLSVANHNQPLRQDIINQTNMAKDVLSNAPSEKYQYYVVPKVIE